MAHGYAVVYRYGVELSGEAAELFDFALYNLAFGQEPYTVDEH